MSTVANAPYVHQGRWGFHPCDYPTFLRLKVYHKLLLRDFRATRRFERWEAKLPKNRVGPQPSATLGTGAVEYRWVLDEYRNARMPVATAAEVKVLDLPRIWGEHLASLEAFYGVG